MLLSLLEHCRCPLLTQLMMMQITQIRATHIQSHSLSVKGNYQSKENELKLLEKVIFEQKLMYAVIVQMYV